jgi:hypothetical protein
MAVFEWQAYVGATPSWTDIATNIVIFSGTSSDLTDPITVAAWQDGSHLGTSEPGTDQCGANHMNNVKYIGSTEMSVNGAATEDINDTNLTESECTMRIQFTNSPAVALTSARLYAYDGTTTTAEAIGVEVNAFERGVSATSWTLINDDSGNTGGDNSGERLDLGDKSSATINFYYLAISASPESVGGKTQFDFGVALTYS